MEIFVIVAGIAAGIALGLGLVSAGLHVIASLLPPKKED